MPKTTAYYVRTVSALIKKRQHLKLFSLLTEISAIGGKQRYEVYRKLALYYPVIVEMFQDARRLEDCEQIIIAGSVMVDGTATGDLSQALVFLNYEFLCATGCDCGCEADLLSESNAFYSHIGHKWFRAWAYKHMSEAFRSQWLPSLEYLREIEKKRHIKIIIDQ